MENSTFLTPEIMNHLNAFLSTLSNASDHSCAILAGSKIDSLLRNAIESRLLPLRPGKKDDALLNGPLGSFSSRIEVAYRLGLITYQHANALDQLRRIRNGFAHGTDNLTFTESPAKERIPELSKCWKGPNFDPFCEELVLKGDTKMRAEFISACSFFITLFTPLSKVGEKIERIKYVQDLQTQLEGKLK